MYRLKWEKKRWKLNTDIKKTKNCSFLLQAHWKNARGGRFYLRSESNPYVGENVFVEESWA